MGVVAGHQGNGLGFGQPDSPQSQDGRVDYVDHVRLEAVDGLGHHGTGQGQLEFRVQGKRDSRNPHHLGAAVGGRRPLRAKHQHIVPSRHKMLNGPGEPGHDPVHLGQKGLGKKCDLHGYG